MAQIPEKDLADTEKNEFYEQWEYFTFKQRLKIKALTAIHYWRTRFFLALELLKTSLWIG